MTFQDKFLVSVEQTTSDDYGSPPVSRSSGTTGNSVADSTQAPIRVGTVVRFLKDAALVKRLQAGRKDWSDEAAGLLSRLPSLVTAIKGDGDIEVAPMAFVNDNREMVITVNPKAVTVTSKGKIEFSMCSSI